MRQRHTKSCLIAGNDNITVQRQLIATGKSTAATLQKCFDDVPVLREFIAFADSILIVAASIELNPDDHFTELVAARDEARRSTQDRRSCDLA